MPRAQVAEGQGSGSVMSGRTEGGGSRAATTPRPAFCSTLLEWRKCGPFVVHTWDKGTGLGVVVCGDMNNQEPSKGSPHVNSLKHDLEMATLTAIRCRTLLQLVGEEAAAPASRNAVAVIVAALNRVWPMPATFKDISDSVQIPYADVQVIGADLVELGLADEVREDTIRLVAKIPLRGRGKAASAVGEDQP